MNDYIFEKLNKFISFLLSPHFYFSLSPSLSPLHYLEENVENGDSLLCHILNVLRTLVALFYQFFKFLIPCNFFLHLHE